MLQVNAAAVGAPVDWKQTAADLDSKSPLEIMDHVSWAFHGFTRQLLLAKLLRMLTQLQGGHCI